MFIGKTIKILAVSLLTVLLFEFIHSELDFITFDSDNHSAHDFCSLVEAASVIKSIDKSIEHNRILSISSEFFFPARGDLHAPINCPGTPYQKSYISNRDIFIINSTLLI